MRAVWESLHTDLTRSLQTLRATKAFARAREQHEELTRFDEAAKVVEFLNDRHSDRDVKDQLLAALVKRMQSGDEHKLASTLLWLGLWPALDAIYRRRRRHFPSNPGELASELTEAFLSELTELNLASVRRVAATIVRSTERRLVDRLARTWRDTAKLESLSDDQQGTDHAELQPDSALGMYCSRDFDTDLERLSHWLLPVLADDTELVLNVVALGESQLSAGDRQGITHAATRKRFERALGRIRTHLLRSRSQGNAYSKSMCGAVTPPLVKKVTHSTISGHTRPWESAFDEYRG